MTAILSPSVLIHCEGTRFTEKKHQISMQVAQLRAAQPQAPPSCCLPALYGLCGDREEFEKCR